MRVGRTFVLSLLAGYCFRQHVFRPESPSSLSSMRALYEQWGMRITRLCLPERWYDYHVPLIDEASGASLLPSSLEALALGHVSLREEAESMFAHLGTLASTGHLRADEAEPIGSTNGYKWLRRVETQSSWRMKPYSKAEGGYPLKPIPPGAIPQGVRFLQLAEHYNRPLLPGAIPATVRFLQCGHSFNQPPEEGALPEGLTHLILGDRYAVELPSGGLPSSLQRLRLGGYDQPLQPHHLPPRLERLDMGVRYNQPLPPGVLPPTLTHVRLSDRFNQRSVKGSIPRSVVHLSMGRAFNFPLPAGVLPSALHELLLSDGFRHPLEPGSLPNQLRLLRMPAGYAQTLHSSLWPSTLQAIDLTGYMGEVAEGVLPASLRWLSLYDSQVEHIAVPANTDCFLKMEFDTFG